MSWPYGGGVDIVSWEFPRTINEAEWNEADKPLNDRTFVQEGEQRTGSLVDRRTGRLAQFRKDEVQHLPYDPEKDFAPTGIDKYGQQILKPIKWEDYKRWVEVNKKLNAQNAVDPDTEKRRSNRPIHPYKIYVVKQYENQRQGAEGGRAMSLRNADESEHELDRIQTKLDDGAYTQEQIPGAKDAVVRITRRIKDFRNSAMASTQQVKEIDERIKSLVTLKDYALERSTNSYAEAGITAMHVYQEGLESGNVTKPMHVGPEIGWPTYYGGHPDEFIELIEESRKKMIDMLTKKELKQFDKDANEEKNMPNPYFDSRINKRQAEKLAEEHIQGVFDTGHMGMWLSHFKPQPGETEDHRIKRFHKWFTDKVEVIAAKKNLVGGIQLVDSGSGAHGHLPPGEGIHPVMETARIFKKHDFEGFVVSEGHEEEAFQQGRIRMKTWQQAGAGVGKGYFAGPPMQWQQVAQSYFGRTYSPQFMFGGYSPSNEFRLWSEVPLE